MDVTLVTFPTYSKRGRWIFADNGGANQRES